MRFTTSPTRDLTEPRLRIFIGLLPLIRGPPVIRYSSAINDFRRRRRVLVRYEFSVIYTVERRQGNSGAAVVVVVVLYRVRASRGERCGHASAVTRANRQKGGPFIGKRLLLADSRKRLFFVFAQNPFL